jgi:hypothetical protein
VVDLWNRNFDASELQDAVKATLRRFFPQYMAEYALQGNWDPIPPVIRSYESRNRFDKLPEEQLPMAIVISPGLVNPPKQDGGGKYSGWYGIGVGIVASAKDEEETDRLAKRYAAIVRKILLDHPTLEGEIASGVEWIDESFDDVPDEDGQRTIKASRSAFQFWIEDIVTRGGPQDEQVPPGTDWPEIHTAVIDRVEVSGP